MFKPSVTSLTLRSGPSTYLLQPFSSAPTSPFRFYAGQETQTGKECTIKVHVRNGKKENDRAGREKLAFEKHLADSCPHPCVAGCSVVGQGIIESRKKIEFVDFAVFEPVGASLSEVIARATQGEEKVRESQIKRWFRQIVEVIDFLHTKDVAYGGLNLDAVRLTPALDRVVLLGFEKATIVQDTERRNPEAFAMDIYLAGVMLFCMRTMRYPFGTVKEKESVDPWMRLFYSPQRLSYWEGVARQVRDISVEFINLINGMLEAEPAKRFTSERVLKHQYLAFK